MERDHANDIIVKLELFTHNYELYMCHKLINFSINMYISMVGRRWMLVPIKPKHEIKNYSWPMCLHM